MAEKSEVPDPGSTKDTKDSAVRKVHYIVHLDRETDQIIKIEELDEATNTTREMPLPLFLVDPAEKAGGGATGLVFDLPQPTSFNQPMTAFVPPYSHYGYPMPWPMMPPQFAPPPPCVAAQPPPVNFAAPPSMADAHVVISTPKVDPPDPPNAPVAHLVYSTPKVDPPDERVSMAGMHTVISTPKVDPPDPPNAMLTAHLVFQTPKSDPPDPPNVLKDKGEGSGVKGGRAVGPCLKFRFKSE